MKALGLPTGRRLASDRGRRGSRPGTCRVVLHGARASGRRAAGVGALSSVSHEGDYAAAVVVATRQDEDGTAR